MITRSIFLAVFSLFFLALPAGAQDVAEGLTLYAPLEGAADAAQAGGAKEPTVQKGLKFVEGKFGQGVELGGNAQLYYSGAGNINLSEGTVAFWAKRNEAWASKKGYVLFKATAVDWNKSALYLMVTEWSQLRAWVWDDEGKQYLIMSPNNIPYAVGEWYHVAMTFTDGEVRIYVNGEEISYAGSAKSNPMMSMPTGTPKNIQFGSDYDGALFNGVMDELRIYNRVLTPEEIKALYQFVPATK